MFMKKILLIIGLCVALIFSAKADAQVVPQGPFQNQSALIAMWQQFDPSGAAYVYLDGQLVFQRGGFGPAASGRYFTCPGGSVIRTSCPQNGPFSDVNAIVGYWSPWAASTVSATYIYVDNQLVYQFPDGFGPAMLKHYVYCPNRGGYMTNCSL